MGKERSTLSSASVAIRNNPQLDKTDSKLQPLDLKSEGFRTRKTGESHAKAVQWNVNVKRC